MAVMSVKDDEKDTGISYYKDDKWCSFSAPRAEQFAELCSANYVRKERARMRNPAGSYPGPYLRPGRSRGGQDARSAPWA